MRIRILGTLAILLAAAGLAAADPGQFGTMSIFDKHRARKCASCTAATPCCIETVPIPPVQLFRAEVGCPTYVPGRQLPPVELVRGVPPPVELVRGMAPPVEVVRGMPPPVELVRGMPPPVELFRKQAQPPEYAPPIKVPSVTLFKMQQPPCPCVPPPVCPPCACGGTP